MRYRVTHTTAYNYQQTVGLSYNEVRMLPRPSPNQQVIDTKLQISPAPCDYRVRTDFFGNQVAWFSIREPHLTFQVTAVSEVRVIRQPAQTDLGHGIGWETAREILRSATGDSAVDARQYALDSPLVNADPDLAAYAQPSFVPGRSLPEAIHDLMQRIHRDFTFDPEFTNLATPLATVLEHRRGVCRILPIWPSVASARRGWRRVTSAVTSKRYRRPAKPNWSVPTLPTPGFRCICRTWAGWTSTRPTTRRPATGISSSPGAATTATSRR